MNNIPNLLCLSHPSTAQNVDSSWTWYWSWSLFGRLWKLILFPVKHLKKKTFASVHGKFAVLEICTRASRLQTKLLTGTSEILVRQYKLAPPWSDDRRKRSPPAMIHLRGITTRMGISKATPSSLIENFNSRRNTFFCRSSWQNDTPNTLVPILFRAIIFSEASSLENLFLSWGTVPEEEIFYSHSDTRHSIVVLNSSVGTVHLQTFNEKNERV